MLDLFPWNASASCCNTCPAGKCPCSACGYYERTNILFEGTSAVAIFDDVGNEKNASRRFKAWGNLAQHAISKNKAAANKNGNGNGSITDPNAKYKNKGSHEGGARSALFKTKASIAAAANDRANDTVPWTAPWKVPWKAPQQAGIAVSANGLDWTDYKELQSPANMSRNMWRFDAQASMFYDERRQQYIGTNRAFRHVTAISHWYLVN